MGDGDKNKTGCIYIIMEGLWDVIYTGDNDDSIGLMILLNSPRNL